MPKDQRLYQAADRTVERGLPKRVTSIAVCVTSSAVPRTRCTVVSISRMGAEVELGCRLRRDENILLLLPHLAPLCCRVVWSSGVKSELAFLSPLSRSVLEQLLEIASAASSRP